MIDRFEDDFADYSEDASISAEQISNILSGSTDWTTDTIVRQIEKGNIDLSPMFQRRDAWNIGRKSLFIESLALGFPIPQIVLAQQKSGKFIVLDGKQRLLTLMQFFGKNDYTPFKLKNMTILKELNGKDYDNLADNDSTSNYLTKIENATIRTVVIKNWEDDSVLYQIFLRLNTTSVPLSPQELRGALFPGKFVDYINQEAASNKFLQSLFKGERDFRMRDSELLIRYIAYKHFHSLYTGNLKKFLDITCKTFNDNWDNQEKIIENDFFLFKDACKILQDIFGDNIFCKFSPEKLQYERSVNRAVFDIMVFYFSIPQIASAASNYYTQIENKFRELCTNNIEFITAISSTTKSLSANAVRFRCWGSVLKNILNIPIEIPEFKNDEVR